MKVLAGDWKEDSPVVIKKDWLGKPEGLLISIGVFKHETMKFSDLVNFELVTEENKASILGKVGWGAVGAIALGPVGLLAGVLGGGNKRDRVMVLEFRDGRSLMLKGSAKDAELLMAKSFGNRRAELKVVEAAPIEKIEPKP